MFSKVIYIERKRHELPGRRTFRFTGTSQVRCFYQVHRFVIQRYGLDINLHEPLKPRCDADYSAIRIACSPKTDIMSYLTLGKYVFVWYTRDTVMCYKQPGSNFIIKDLPSVLIPIIDDQMLNDSLCCSKK